MAMEWEAIGRYLLAAAVVAAVMLVVWDDTASPVTVAVVTLLCTACALAGLWLVQRNKWKRWPP
jgi:hypothetical protein